MQSPCYSFAIALVGEVVRSGDNGGVGDSTAASSPRPVGQGGRDRLRETSLLMRIPEGRAAYLAIRTLLSLADDDGDGGGENVRGRGGGWIGMRQ